MGWRGVDDPKVRQGPRGAVGARRRDRACSLGRREHWTGDDDLVFAGEAGSYLDGSALRRRYKAALAEAGLRQLRFTHDFQAFVPSRPGAVVVAGESSDTVPVGTLGSIRKASGLEQLR